MPTTTLAPNRAFTYVGCLGRTAVQGNGFSHPQSVARGANDVLYVANRGTEWNPAARITKCTLQSEFLLDIGSPGQGSGQFLWPAYVALDSNERVYVSEESANKIMVFENDGSFIAEWGTSGDKDGELHDPTGIVFDKDDNLFLVDTRNNRIQKFSPDGKFLSNFGASGSGPSQFNLPWGIAMDSTGNLYIADTNNDRVQKLSPEGDHILTFGSSSPGELNRPSDVTIDKDGDVYVSDWGNNRIQIYSADGGYLATLIGDATELSPWAQMTVNANIDYIKARARADLEAEWRFRRPTGLTIDDDYRLVIAEAQHNRAQVYLKDVGYEDPQFNL